MTAACTRARAFADEFGPTARFDVDAAFSDFIDWLEREQP